MEFSTLKYRLAGNLQAPAGWHLKSHHHTFHEIIILLRGAERVQIGGQTLVAGPGDVLLYPAGVAHAEWADSRNGFESLYLCFDWRPISRLPLLLHDSSARIRQLAAWLHEDRDSHFPQASEAQQGLMRALIMECARAAHRAAQPHGLAESVQDHIRQHLTDRLDLSRLARHARMSKFHFLRTYKGLAGRTPMAEVRAVRLGRARELLLTTSQPIKNIAAQCGFANEYLLSRLFKKSFGMPPGQMRRR